MLYQGQIGSLSRVHPAFSPSDNSDRLQHPHKPELDKYKKMDGWKYKSHLNYTFKEHSYEPALSVRESTIKYTQHIADTQLHISNMS